MPRFSNILLTASLCLAALLLLGCLAPGRVQAAAMDGVLEKAQAEGRLTQEEAEAIKTRIGQARTQGLPSAPFTAKVDEGLAKRIPGRAIIHALDAMRDDYVFAQDALARGGHSPAPEDIALAGDSLRLGLSRPELTELATLEPPAPASMLATAARTRAYLNAIAFPTELSANILRQGLASGALTPGWSQLFRVVQRARGAGMADAAVAEAASRTLAEMGGLNALLQELGFTGRDTRQAPGDIGK